MGADQDINGEWEQGGHTMLNHSGATFDMTTFGRYGGSTEGYLFNVYNLDINKLQIIPLDAKIELVDTYTLERNPQPTKQAFYMKDGYRIALASNNGNTFTTKKISNTETEVFIEFVNDATGIGDGMGFYATTIDFQVKYDGKIIGTIKADSVRTGPLSRFRTVISS